MFRIKEMGCDYRHDTSFFIERPHGYDCYLILFLKSRSLLYDGEEPVRCRPNTFILYDVHAEHKYGADGEEYVEDWISFECSGSFISRLNLPMNRPVYIGETVHLENYFSLIQNVFFRCINDDEITDHLFQAMLTEVSYIANGREKVIPHFRELSELKNAVYADPAADWTVKRMADRLHISEPYLQELFKKAFGESAVSSVIRARISFAKSLLISTDMTVAAIAEKCGYNSTVHFSRQFRRETGFTPVEWKKRSY